MRRLVVVLLLAVATVLGTSRAAEARREYAFSYPFVRVWETAVRLVRVDLESVIGEKNREDGYFLFEYPHEGKTHPGSVEFVRAGAGGVRVVVQISAMPSYVEQIVLDRLKRKLASEYGEPPEPAPAEKPPAAPAPKDDGKAPSADAKPKASRDDKSVK